MISHTNGTAITLDISTNFKKSLDSSRNIFGTEDPSTLRIPISFVRWAAVNEAKPKSPREATKIARAAKKPNT